MKRLFLLILIAFFGASSIQVNAQPTLTAANTNMVIGEQYISNGFVPNASHFVTGLPAGANQSWNFSSFSQVSSGPVKILFRPSAPITASIIQNSDATINYPYFKYEFFKLNADSVALTGYTDSNDFSQYYQNPVKRLKYPFTFNSNFIDNFVGNTQSMAFTWPNYGHIVVKADSYGTLILPSGSVTNVLRVKSVMVSNEISSVDSTTTLDWYLPGVHLPILSIRKQKFSSNPTNTYYQGYYINPFALSVKEATAANVNLQVFPNPATSELAIQYQTPKPVKITLHDLVGKQVAELHSGKGSAALQNLKINVANYPKGIYLLKLETEGEVFTRKVMLQ